MAITDNETTTTPPSGGRITDELRKYIRDTARWGISPTCEKGLTAIADRIDAEHKKAIASVMNDALYHANDKDMADLGWVRKNKEHVISHATVEVAPHIDWSRMADELDEFVKIVRGMAGGVE